MKSCVPYIGVLSVAWGLIGAADGLCVETNKYTLDECVKIGLERATRLENARRGELSAAATVKQASAQAFPRVALSGTYTRLDKLQSISLGEGEPVEMGTLDNYSALAQLTQLVYSGGKVQAAIDAARLYRSLAEWGTAVTKDELLRDIKKGFYGILLARAAVVVREESLVQVKNYVDQTQKKFDAGKASEFDLLTAKVRLANERPGAMAAQNLYKLGIERYRLLLGLDGAPFELVGALERKEPGVESREEVADTMMTRPVLRQMATRVALMEQDVIAARSAYYPSISAVFNYNGANSYQFATYGNSLEWHWNASLVLSWDLWDSGLRSATVRQKRIDLEIEKANLEELKKAVSLEIRQARMELELAEDQIKASGDSVELAERGLAIAKTRYESGSSTYIEFLDANLACNMAKLNRSQAHHDYLAALAQLEYACGQAQERSTKETTK